MDKLTVDVVAAAFLLVDVSCLMSSSSVRSEPLAAGPQGEGKEP